MIITRFIAVAFLVVLFVTKDASAQEIFSVAIVATARQPSLEPVPVHSTEPRSSKEGAPWLTVTVDLTPPKAGTTLSAKEVTMVDASSNRYTAAAFHVPLPGHTDAKFNFFDDASILLEPGRSGLQGSLQIRREGTTILELRHPSVFSFPKTDPVRIVFAFEVPSHADNLSLEIDKTRKVALP